MSTVTRPVTSASVSPATAPPPAAAVAGSPAHFLVGGLALSPLPDPPREAPAGAVCPLTGERVTLGYPVQEVIPDSTGEWLDLLRGDTHGWLSETAARAVKGDWNLGNRAIFRRPDGGAEAPGASFDAYYPLISGASAADSAASDDGDPDVSGMSSKKMKTFTRDGRLPRPSWSRLVRDVWPARAGQACLMLLATDPKKRVWNRGRVGVLGEDTPLLLFDPSRHLLRVARVSWPRLIGTLDLVEAVYSAGFSKRAITDCLYADAAAVKRVGAARTAAWERESLAPLRATDEFFAAVIIAQKSATPAGPS